MTYRRASKQSPRRGQRSVQPGVPNLLRALSQRRRELIRPVFEQPRDYVLLTIRELARRLNTDAATAQRIVRGMGFGSHREFKAYLHDLSITLSTTLDGMQAAPHNGTSVAARIRESLNCDLKSLQALRHSLDPAQLTRVARLIYSARRVLILAGDAAGNLGSHLAYHLTFIGVPALVALTPGGTATAVRVIGKGDLVIAMSFRRGLRQTVEGMRAARTQGAYCVGVTDTFLSPVARLADECFLASVESRFGDSYVAPVALLNALIVACAYSHQRRTLSLLKQAEKEQRTGFRWYQEEGPDVPRAR